MAAKQPEVSARPCMLFSDLKLGQTIIAIAIENPLHWILWVAFALAYDKVKQEQAKYFKLFFCIVVCAQLPMPNLKGKAAQH